MITEDYVSFEVAKLLKEKGFECGAIYSKGFVKDGDGFVGGLIRHEDKITHQMAMKWLREKGYHIVVFTDSPKYEVKIQDLNDGSFNVSGITHTYDTYEEAVEAALKYCLTNLIKNETN